MKSNLMNPVFVHPWRGACVVFLLVTALGAFGQTPQGSEIQEQVVLKTRGPGGEGARVVVEQGHYHVARITATSRLWTRELPDRPNFLQGGNAEGTIAVGFFRNDGSPRWAMVFTASGEGWSPPGEVQSIHLSKQGNRVLARVRVEGRDEAVVFDAAGRELVRFAVPGAADHPGVTHVVRFTARGDGVAVTPGPEEDSSVLEVHDIATGRSQRHQMDPAFPMEDAVALDVDHVVVVGGGRLTMVLFPGADEFAEEGPVGWSLGTQEPGYLTLMGATADGERLLATRGLGRFDLVEWNGEVSWSFDPATSPLRPRLVHLDLGRHHPFLHADGTVELKDDSGRGRYLLTWPQGLDRDPVVRWEAAAAPAE